MKDIGRLFIKLFIILFTLLFIFPAILFSVLVLGFSSRRLKKIASSRGESSHFIDSQSRIPIPPPLSDIYREFDFQYGETDVLYRTILESESETHPNDKLMPRSLEEKKKES